MKSVKRIEATAVLPQKKKIRVAAYCRVSTDADEQLVSLETQKSHYRQHINSNPDWEFAGLYYDEGISATKTDKRLALHQMISDCEAGKIDYIVTKSLSRFARNTTDCLELVRKLQEINVPVFFEKENINTGTMDNEFLLSVMSSLAEGESVSISENEKWSIQNRYANGSYKIGYPPYGYDSNDGEFSINETEAQWIRYIFSETLKGQSLNRISKALISMHVPTRKNGAWNASTVRGIIINEKYTGDCLFQKTFTDFRFKRHPNNGDRDQYLIENHHPAIISHEDFDRANQMVRQHANEKKITKGDKKYTNRYPFSGKIICGECGEKFKRKSNITGALKYPSWVCRVHFHDTKKCSMKGIKEADLERTFMLMLNKLIFARKDVLQTFHDDLKEHNATAIPQRMKAIDAAIDKNTEKKKTLTKIMAQNLLEPSLFIQESNELNAESNSLAAEKESIIQSSAKHVDEIEETEKLIKFTAKAEMFQEFDGELVNNYLDHITVHSPDEVTFHLKCGLSLKERILK